MTDDLSLKLPPFLISNFPFKYSFICFPLYFGFSFFFLPNASSCQNSVHGAFFFTGWKLYWGNHFQFPDLTPICNETTLKSISSKEHLPPTYRSVHSAHCLSCKPIFLKAVYINPVLSGQKSVSPPQTCSLFLWHLVLQHPYLNSKF